MTILPPEVGGTIIGIQNATLKNLALPTFKIKPRRAFPLGLKSPLSYPTAGTGSGVDPFQFGSCSLSSPFFISWAPVTFAKCRPQPLGHSIDLCTGVFRRGRE